LKNQAFEFGILSIKRTILMKTKIQSWLTVFLFVVAGIFICDSVQAQDEYRGLNAQRDPVLGNDASTPAAAPAAPAAPAVPTMQQQMEMQAAQQVGTAIGNALGDALRGDPAQQAAQQQKTAAIQLNNSGVYLLDHANDPAGAIKEFQQALALDPSNPTLAENLKKATGLLHNNKGNDYFKNKDYRDAISEYQQANALFPSSTAIFQNLQRANQNLKDVGIAAKNSSALNQLLGGSDFDGSKNPQASNPNPSVLNSVNLDSDPNVVDLRGTTKTYVDPALVKGDSSSKPADVQQAVKDLNNLLDNNTDQVKKQLDQALGLNQNAPVQQTPGKEGTETTPTESTDSGGTTGIKGLPGIALNDNTGNGGSKPYGIPGLPGTYVNGAGEGSGLTTQPSPSPGSPPTPPPTPPVTATGSLPAPEPEPTPTRTINLGNTGNPDFDGNMGGNSPITASGGSIPTPPSSGAGAVVSPQTGGQPDIVTRGENLKDAVAFVQLPSSVAGVQPLSSFKAFKDKQQLELFENKNNEANQSKNSTEETNGVLLPIAIDESTNECEEKCVDYAESGLSERLQKAIIRSLRKGDIIAVRGMAAGASEQYGKGLGSEPFQPKPHEGDVLVSLGNGMRIMKNGKIVLSDLDLAFIIHDGKPVDNGTALSYGEGIDLLYGQHVVAHGDLYNGIAELKDPKAVLVSMTDKVFVFKYCDGFKESGPFNEMVEKYIGNYWGLWK